MFTCTYKTAWNNHMEKDEKEGFKFEDVIIYMRTHKGFMDSEWKFR
jgi:hypothetical protein